MRVVDQDGETVPQLTRQMQVKRGDAVDANRLSTEANRLYGLRAFEKVGYSLVDDRGVTGVEYTASSNTWGRNFLKFGLAIEDDFEGSTAFNFSSRLWRPGVNRLGAEWRADVRLGTLPLLATEFYQPLSLDSRWFVAPSVRLSQRNIDVFDADRPIARLRVSQAVAALDVGASRQLGRVPGRRVTRRRQCEGKALRTTTSRSSRWTSIPRGPVARVR